MLIIIISYDDPSIQNIQNCLTYLNVDSQIISFRDIPNNLDEISGIILSGGPYHIYEDHPLIPEYVHHLKCSVFGICYGMELIVEYFGGTIKRLDECHTGEIMINDKIQWMNHYDYVSMIPEKLKVVSSYTIKGQQIISSVTDDDRYFGVLYHPERLKPLCSFGNSERLRSNLNSSTDYYDINIFEEFISLLKLKIT
jgi:GMP synthase (glutamine-hydrolysing)